MAKKIDIAALVTIHKVSLLRALLICAAITATLSGIDIISGSEYSFSIFYLLPITIAVFIYGRSLGIAFSIVCAIVWAISDQISGSHYSSMWAIVWNTSVRLMYFLLHTFVLSKLLELISVHKEFSYIDPLTKAANWRYFEAYSNEKMKLVGQNHAQLALAYLDIDNFKQINDRYGHAAGDSVLVSLSETMRKDLRADDILARLGGDEFAIFLYNTDLRAAQETLNRIKREVCDVAERNAWPITLSIGCVVFATLSSDLSAMVRQADELMYEAKRNGKNAIRIVDQTSPAAIRSPVRD